jgi:hypothetical protein
MYMELPTYTYDQMTYEEKRIITEEITRPVVIRGLYEPKARKMSFEQIVKLFGHVKLPVELYDTHDIVTTEAIMGSSSVPNLIRHWETKSTPSVYCAEVDLFEQRVSKPLLDTLYNPNTSARKVEALMLYLGNNHSSGLHLHVNYDYVLNQLFGSKTVYIFDNYDNPNIHKNSVFSVGKSNFAKEDFFKMDHSKMKIYKVTLGPGDSLLIPPWSWHATQGHGINMSITQIFQRKNIWYLLKNPNLIPNYYSDEYLTQLIVVIIILFIVMYFRRRSHHAQ